jgi:hypothetical protein
VFFREELGEFVGIRFDGNEVGNHVPLIARLQASAQALFHAGGLAFFHACSKACLPAGVHACQRDYMLSRLPACLLGWFLASMPSR